ncbi:2Fe-2S iron-sulfur cluster-binding protein [[Mycobacterium] burgundiense]|uniref:2Fe-2S iron-sulfur cluster-binding protein n=1 Tax=[Mycobacterium] burgundiense TaxID=3064286 RepID=UPI0035A09383
MHPVTRPFDAVEAVPVPDSNGFSPLRVKRVVQETDDAVSLILDVPAADRERFDYRAGQFVTLRVFVNGQEHRRCYSMSSSPAVETDLRITVKRDRDGLVSNWLNDTATAGDELHTAPPEGRFVLADTDRDLVAFAGGSGITPVFSLIRTALATTSRRVGLYYANRNRDSVIFGPSLTQLAEAYGERFTVHHHLDHDAGMVAPQQLIAFIRDFSDAEAYICGPAPFMDTAEAALHAAGIPKPRVHLERFTVAAAPAPDPRAAAVTEEVTIELNRSTVTVPYRAGNTLLQTARLAGLKAPSSCETGSCGTCMAQVTEGAARMLNNDALDEDEVADGWVVTCQSLPTTRTVRVVYE